MGVSAPCPKGRSLTPNSAGFGQETEVRTGISGAELLARGPVNAGFHSGVAKR